MIEVKIPKEIRDFKSKVIFNLTARQIICLVLAIAIDVPAYIFLKPIIGDEIASWLVIFLAAPIFLVGFIKKDGMSYEKYILIMLRFSFLTPRIRKYKTENIFTYINNEQKKNSFENKKLKRNKSKGRLKNDSKN